MENLSLGNQNEIQKRLKVIENHLEINQDSDDKDVNKGLTKNDLSLSPEGDKKENYIKTKDYNINMVTKEVKKEEAVQTPATPAAPTNPMEEIKSMLSQILQSVQAPAAPAAPMVAKEDDSDEDEDKEKVEKEENVTLPKTPEEETGEGKPAEGAVDDKVKFVEKEDLTVMKNEIVEEIKKSFGVKEASTPRPANEIKKKAIEEKPKNWNDIEKMVGKRINGN